MKAPQRFFSVVVSAIGVSVVSQGLAFLRQILIAAYFGVSRDLDIYFVAYAVASMVIFNASTVFDASIVPRMVRAAEIGGDGMLSSYAACVFRWSCVIGLVATGLLLVLMPLLAPLVASGFTEAQRQELVHFAWLLVPWVAFSMPYYAVASAHKARRSFNRVFSAELVVTIASIACLAAFHDRVALLPAAYAVGYGAALLWFLPGSGVLGRIEKLPTAEPLSSLRSAAGLYCANQVTSVTGVIDRYFQSHVPAGGIAAVTYSTQLITGLAGLLMFRDIYIVPMAESERRSEKLERLIIGLLLMVIPIVGFVVALSHDIVMALFQRGRFDASATDLTASILSVYALTLVPSVVITPLARMLSILDRVRSMYVFHLSSMIGIVTFGYVFVIFLGLGAVGVAWMLVLSTIGNGVIANVLIVRGGIVLGWWRIGRYAAYSIAVAGLGSGAALIVAAQFNNSWLRLSAAAVIYGLTVALCYLTVRARLLNISGHAASR